ncbi:hypothetical protein Q3G72_021991 [Acer saccharum]|nr:hypothetical protein Q3G72_021991 [Acer saccharum]
MITAGGRIPVDGGVENCEEVRKVSDGDKVTQVDSYGRAKVSASPIPHKLYFENMAETADHSGEGVIRKRCGSLGGKDSFTHYRDAGSVSNKYFEGDLGQVRGESPSEENLREEVVNVGPVTEFSSEVTVLSGNPGHFQADSSVNISGSEVVCGGFCFGCCFWVLAQAAWSVVPCLALLLFGSCWAVTL